LAVHRRKAWGLGFEDDGRRRKTTEDDEEPAASALRLTKTKCLRVAPLADKIQDALGRFAL